MKRTIFFALPLALILLIAYATLTRPGSAPAPCDDAACNPQLVITEQLGANAADAVPAPPCPYCNQDPGKWRSLTAVAPPAISGSSATVLEASCGLLIYGLREDDQHPPASIAKIVTALVAVEQGRLSDRVDVDVDGWLLAATDGSSIAGLEAGMNLSIEDLLYALLLPSGNDAALALADHFGGPDSFVRLMNQRALRSGLTHSHFANPDGRDAADGYTSALDIVLLGRQLMGSADLRRIVGTQTSPAAWDGHTLWNTNYLVYGFPGATGVKFGYTEAANETIVGAASRDGRELMVSVLDSDFAYLDAVKLLNWAFTNTTSSC